MLPLHPEFAADGHLGDDVLGLIRFGNATALDGELRIAAPPVGALSVEVWRSPVPVVRETRDGISFAKNDEVMFGAVADAGDEIESATRRAYQNIVALTRRESYPNLLRVWNHVRDINAGEGDSEQYKRFCAGRHEALTAAGLSKAEFPSASAVGMRDGRIAVYFIAAKNPGQQVENPRQISAYEYPREYGRRSPSFARATVARLNGSAALFVSGTASVVGHRTVHADSSRDQTEETIRNLFAIIGEARTEAADVRTMKIYVRRAAGAQSIASRIAESFPQASLLVVESDICRRDLLVEVEAVAIRSVEHELLR